MNNNYVKLSDLEGLTITIKRVIKMNYKKWDEQQGKYLISETPDSGYAKRWQVELKNGDILELSSYQFSQILEINMIDTIKENSIDFTLKSPLTFLLSTNGELGKEIRYFFNQVEENNTAENVDAPSGNEDLKF